MMPLHRKIGLSKQWLVGVSDGSAFCKDSTVIKAQFWTQLQVCSANISFFDVCVLFQVVTNEVILSIAEASAF